MKTIEQEDESLLPEGFKDPFAAKFEHYKYVPDLAKTGRHHKEIGSQREVVNQNPELDPLTDLQLMDPQGVITKLRRELDFAIEVSKQTPEQLRGNLAQDAIFRYRYEDLRDNLPLNIPYLTDQVESGEYQVSDSERDEIYELLTLLKSVEQKLGFEIKENYTTKTLEETEQEKSDAQAA